MSKISNLFFKNYLIIFLLTVISSFIAVILLAFASNIIENSLAKNQYSKDSILKDNISQIDATSIVENGGGLQIIDDEYNVIYSVGLNTFSSDSFSVLEFTNFLTNSNNNDYNYDIYYQKNNQNWIVVSFPTSLRMEFFFSYNSKANKNDKQIVLYVIIIVLIVYLLLLAVFSYIFAKISSKSITKPLRKLTDGTKLLRQGDYSVRVDLNLRNEFEELQNTFNDMAQKIEREITLRKISEDNRKKLILDISHDLKNPLFSIMGYSKYCIDNKISQEEEKNYLNIIYENSKRSSSLMNELFELSKMENPEFKLNFQSINIVEYLREYCASIINQLETNSFNYEFNLSEDDIYTMLDSEKFKRVLNNLLENSFRYNKKGTKLTINLIQEDNKVAIIFKDDGLGIPDENKRDIFKPFVRGNNAKEPSLGSGLGLSIVKKIISLHNGTIKLEDSSTSTEFVITLPII